MLIRVAETSFACVPFFRTDLASSTLTCNFGELALPTFFALRNSFPSIPKQLINGKQRLEGRSPDQIA